MNFGPWDRNQPISMISCIINSIFRKFGGGSNLQNKKFRNRNSKMTRQIFEKVEVYISKNSRICADYDSINQNSKLRQ